MPRRHRKTAGLTLFELMPVLGLVGPLASIEMTFFDGRRDRARVDQAQGDIVAISPAVDAFLADQGRLPLGCDELQGFPFARPLTPAALVAHLEREAAAA